jgi:hypothetical protein
MKAAVFALTLGTLALTGSAMAQDRTFGGYECKDDCEGHSAGYKWAEEKGMTTRAACPWGNSKSFHEACIAFTADPTHDPDEDDDGNPVGVPVVPPEER